MPRIRHQPEDFVVDEIPSHPLEGRGPHTYLRIEKRLTTTDEVLRRLARATGVPAKAIGYAGRKDKFAVARQWFSVPDLDPKKAERLELVGATVLEVDRDLQKLRTGDLEGNRFRLVVREVGSPEARRAVDLLRQLADKGMPNRYGRQRFGRHGGNVEKGIAILRSDRIRIERRTAWLLVSAVQSAVFNEVLNRRPFPLDQVVPGDVAIDHRTDELFTVENVGHDGPRAARFEVSATGPIFGTKMRRPSGAVATLERAAMEALGLPDVAQMILPRGLRLLGSRRPLRVRVADVESTTHEDGLELTFTLPAGSYATTLVEEIFPDGVEEGPPRQAALAG